MDGTRTFWVCLDGDPTKLADGLDEGVRRREVSRATPRFCI